MGSDKIFCLVAFGAMVATGTIANKKLRKCAEIRSKQWHKALFGEKTEDKK